MIRAMRMLGLVASLLASASTWAATALWYQTDSGPTHLYQAPGNTFQFYALSDHVTMRSTDSLGNIVIEATVAPPTGQTLGVGAYESAQRYAVPGTSPGIELMADGVGCNTETGRFVVLELVRDAGSNVVSFAADLEDHCDGGPTARYVEIRYNSTVPLTISKPGGTTSPDAFAFPPQTFAAPGAMAISDSTTIYGINAPSPISAAGGEYSVNGGSFVSSPGTVNNRDKVRVRVAASSSEGATTSATLTVGGTSAAFTVTTYATGIPFSAVYIQSSPGNYVADGRTFLGTPPEWSISPVASGTDSVHFHFIGPATFDNYDLFLGAVPGTTLSVGPYEASVRYSFRGNGTGVELSGGSRGCNETRGRFVVLDDDVANDRFAANFEQLCDSGPPLFGEVRWNSAVPLTSMKPAGTTLPDPFAFNAQSPVSAGSIVASNSITIYGVNAAVPISITGGEYSLNGGPFTSDPGTAYNTDHVVVRVHASDAAGGVSSATFNAGGRIATFTVTTFLPGTALTGLYFRSQSGDFIGGGATATYVAPADRLTVSQNLANGVSFTLNGALGDWWYLNLAGPDKTPLAPGYYANAQEYPTQAAAMPGLDFSGDGRGCDQIAGSFAVYELEYGPDGSVQRFAADFEQSCELTEPPLYGQVRYNSTVPFSYLLAALTSPADGSILYSSTQTFQWTGDGADVYQLWLGHTLGGDDIGQFPASGTTSLSTVVSGIPIDGRAIYARIRSCFAGTCYSNDSTYATRAPASVTLSSSANPSTVGDSVTFTASVTGGFATPTGSITFLDGSTPICGAVALSSGLATCTSANLSPGTHAISAQYSGDSIYASAGGTGLTQTVNAATASVSLASSTNPSNLGSSVTFTATVSGLLGTPTGSVAFLDGSTAICSAAPVSAGRATCATASLAAGMHSITASYSGDGIYGSATSSALPQAVEVVPVNVALASAGAVATASSSRSASYPAAATINGDRSGAGYGSGGIWVDATSGAYPDWLQVQFASAQTIDRVIVYSMQDNYPSPADPGDTLTFKNYGVVDFQVQGWNGSSWVTLGNVSGNNLVKRTVTFSPVSTDRIRVVITQGIGGSSRLAEVEAWSVAGTPSTATASVNLSASANPSNVGDSVTFTATVSDSAGTPTGSVVFLDGSTTICGAVPLSSGQATCATSNLAAGTHSITASYSGDGSYGSATSSALTQVVGTALPAVAAVTLSSDVNPSAFGQLVVITANVTGSFGTPTGTVTFFDGSAAVCLGLALSAGQTTCAVPNPTVGTHSITVSYSGDRTYGPVTSSAFMQTVTSAPTSSGTVALSSSANPSTLGQLVTYTASVTGGFGTATGWVTFLDNGSLLCGAATLSSGQATCATASLGAGAHSITVSYSGDGTYVPAGSSGLSQTVNAVSITPVNVALASAGAVATASSSYGANYPASAAINGDRSGAVYGRGGMWVDATPSAYPDWLQVQFASVQTIDHVIVYSMQDSYSSPVDPGDALTFAHYGVVDFQVQAWNGASWATLGSVTGNNLVKRTVTFSPVSTDRIRVLITQGRGGSSRLAEVEAWSVSGAPSTASASVVLSSTANPSNAGDSVTFTATVSGSAGTPTGSVAFLDGSTTICGAAPLSSGQATCATASLAAGAHSITASYSGDGSYGSATSSALSQVVNAVSGTAVNVALASTGAVATASSSHGATYPPSAAIDGDRSGAGYGRGGIWVDATSGAYPDWLQVQFASTQAIDRVVVYSMQDNYAAPVDPSDTMTFRSYGVVDFQVQAWNGSSWVTLGSVTGNSLVKRTVTFSPVSTDRIRVVVTQGLGGSSRLAEVEAWTN